MAVRLAWSRKGIRSRSISLIAASGSLWPTTSSHAGARRWMPRGAMAWKPVDRERYVSAACRPMPHFTTSADTGAVRDVTQVQR